MVGVVCIVPFFMLSTVFSDTTRIVKSVSSSLEFRRPKENTLVYLISTTTVLPAVDQSKMDLSVGLADIACFDLSSNRDIMTDLKKFAASRKSAAIVVISGIESLAVDQRSRLNFLHGCTDSNSPFSLLAIFLTWDTATHPIPEGRGHSDYFEEFIGQGMNINSAALAGRMKLIDLSADLEQAVDLPADICSSFPSASTQPIDVTAITVVALILIAALYLCRGDKPKSLMSIQAESHIRWDPSSPAGAVTQMSGGTEASHQTPRIHDQSGDGHCDIHEDNDYVAPDIVTPRRSSRLSSKKKKQKR